MLLTSVGKRGIFPPKDLEKIRALKIRMRRFFFFLFFKVKFILLYLLLRLINILILYIYQGKRDNKSYTNRCFNFLSFIFSFSKN